MLPIPRSTARQWALDLALEFGRGILGVIRANTRSGNHSLGLILDLQY